MNVSGAYELRSSAVATDRGSFSFSRDAAGHVDLYALSQRAFDNDLYARAMRGRDVSWPDVRPSTTH